MGDSKEAQSEVMSVASLDLRCSSHLPVRQECLPYFVRPKFSLRGRRNSSGRGGAAVQEAVASSPPRLPPSSGVMVAIPLGLWCTSPSTSEAPTSPPYTCLPRFFKEVIPGHLKWWCSIAGPGGSSFDTKERTPRRFCVLSHQRTFLLGGTLLLLRT